MVILFALALGLLFVELSASPYVVTAYSKGCWSVNTDGLFNHFNVRGCGNQSWMMVDVYAHVHTLPVANGANDLSVVLSQGSGPGGSCVGGSLCQNLWTYTPPSPLVCNGCVVTQFGPNPLADWATGGNGGTLATFPFITWILLLYLAGAILATPRIYSDYLRGGRQDLDWQALTDRRKTLTTFSLGFLVFTTYQFIATWISLLYRPVPAFSLFGEGWLFIPVVVWLARFLRWKFPFYSASFGPLTPPSSKGTAAMSQPFPQATPVRGSHKPVILGIALILALVTASVAGPLLYSYAAAALAPKTNLQVVATPAGFIATPGKSSNTTIKVKNLRAPTAHITLSVSELSPPCLGTCPSPFPCAYTPCAPLNISLSKSSFILAPGQNATTLFKANPNGWDDPGDYDLVVTATPDQGIASSTPVTVHLAGFNMTADPSALNFTRTYSDQSRITIKSIYGYSGFVTFYAYTDPCRWPRCPNGPVVTLSAQNLTLQSNTEASVILTVASQAQGDYKVVMTAKSGVIFRDIEMPIATLPTSSFADFNLTAIPSDAKVNPGETIDVAIEVSSLNGCICIVQVVPKGNLSYGWGGPVYVDPTHNANATITLTPTLQPGIVTVIVTGTCGTINHFVTVTLDVT